MQNDTKHTYNQPLFKYDSCFFFFLAIFVRSVFHIFQYMISYTSSYVYVVVIMTLYIISFIIFNIINTAWNTQLVENHSRRGAESVFSGCKMYFSLNQSSSKYC